MVENDSEWQSMVRGQLGAVSVRVDVTQDLGSISSHRGKGHKLDLTSLQGTYQDTYRSPFRLAERRCTEHKTLCW